MRTIKFRAWDIDSSEMFYTDKDNHSQYFFFSFTEGNLDLFMSVEDDYPENRKAEIMQFTGLVDKKGKEIYEGDILHKPLQSMVPKFIVEWNKEQCCFDEIPRWGNGKVKTVEFTIIGNIYENPELLSTPTAVL